MAPSRLKGERISDVLNDARHAVGSMSILARHLGLSPKTVARYINHGARPPEGKRSAMLHDLAPHIDAALLGRLGTALDVDEAFWPRPGARVLPSLDAIELAVLLAAEQHGVTPAGARAVALDVLRRVAELGIHAATAHAALSSAVAKRAGIVAR